MSVYCHPLSSLLFSLLGFSIRAQKEVVALKLVQALLSLRRVHFSIYFSAGGTSFPFAPIPPVELTDMKFGVNTLSCCLGFFNLYLVLYSK